MPPTCAEAALVEGEVLDGTGDPLPFALLLLAELRLGGLLHAVVFGGIELSDPSSLNPAMACQTEVTPLRLICACAALRIRQQGGRLVDGEGLVVTLAAPVNGDGRVVGVAGTLAHQMSPGVRGVR
jgi:hypothetical protein